MIMMVDDVDDSDRISGGESNVNNDCSKNVMFMSGCQ